MARSTSASSRFVRRAFITGLFLVAYGNAVSLLLGTVATPDGWWPNVPLGLLLGCLALLWGWRSERLTAAQLGLAPGHVLRSASVGLVVAIGVAVPSLVFLRFPPLVGHAVEYAPVGALSTAALLWRAFLWMPLDTVIPEELAFRGVLLAMLVLRCSRVRAAVASALVFAAWHGVIVSRTIAATNLQSDRVLAGLGLTGAFAAVFVGGMLFAWIRLATGHLAGAVVAHWTFNAVVLLGVATIG